MMFGHSLASQETPNRMVLIEAAAVTTEADALPPV